MAKIESHYLNKPASTTLRPVKKYQDYVVTWTDGNDTDVTEVQAVSEDHAVATVFVDSGRVGGRWAVRPA